MPDPSSRARSHDGVPWRGPSARAIAAAVALAAAVVVGLVWTFPPSPVPRDAPAADFSAERARAHIEAIARRPHPAGSAEHARVRDYLVGQLRALGLEVEIQEAISFQTRHGRSGFAGVKNIVARRRGKGNGKPLLLVAHYDSRGMTPGASDDGYGVATLLETARALGASGKDDLGPMVFLFTDAEEGGLFGAHEFVGSHAGGGPGDVGAVLNFEARGDEGPVMMFQTGGGNGALIRELAQAVPRPAANSLSQALYLRMPNDTDLTEWLPAAPALNFANIGGFERYHSPTDTVENVDLGTLQHHGNYALGLARALGAHALPLPAEPDAVYFGAGPFFVRYPGALERPLAYLAVILAIAFVVLGHRRGALRAPFAVLGLLVVTAIAVAAAAASGLLWGLAVKIHPDYALVNAAIPVLKHLHVASFMALGAALAIGMQAALMRRIRAAEVLAGTMILFAGLAVLAATALPGSSFLFTWPVLGALPFALGLAFTGPFDRDTRGAVVATIAASVPALILVSPFLPQLFSAFGPAAAPAVGGLAALLAMSAAPAVHLMLAPSRRALPFAALGVAAALAIAGNLCPAFDRGHPRPDTVFFAVNADDGNAFWCSPDASAPPWAEAALAGATRRRLPLPLPIAEVLTAPATAAPEPGPEIVWVSDAPVGPERTLRVRVVPPPGADLLAVHASGVVSARVEGHGVPLDAGALAFRFYAPPAVGVEIELAAAPAAPVVVQAVSQREGFPASAAPAVGQRPPDRMAKPGMMPPWDPLLESDRTIVARSATR